MTKPRFLLAIAAALLHSAPASPPLGRHIRLAEDDKPTPGLVRFLSQAITLADDAKQTWVTVTRTGDFSAPRYGNFSITLSMLQQMVRNFDARVVGQDIFLDVAHKHSNGSAAKVLKLAIQDNKLRALVEWTPFGVDAVKNRGFAYLSAEYHEAYEDPETKQQHGCTLLAAGLTTRPVIKRLDPIQLSADDADHDAPARVAISPSLLRELQEQQVNYLDQLKAKYAAMGLSDAVATKLLAQAKAQFDAAASDQVKSLALIDTWAATGQGVVDQLKALGQGNPTQPVPQNVTITLASPEVDVAAAVQKILAARDVRLWKHLDGAAAGGALPLSDNESMIEVRLRRFASFQRFQRNRFIESLAAMGLGGSEIHAAVKAELGENLTRNHILRLARRGRMPR